MPVIPIDNCGEFGLIKDAYSHELAPNGWSAARNVHFNEGYAAKIPGHVQVYGTPLTPPYFLLNFLAAEGPGNPGGNAWVYAGLEKICAVDSNFEHSNITRQSGGLDVDYTGTADDRWNGGVLSSIIILNNGIDVPQFWPGVGRAADLTYWPSDTRCKILRPFRNYLIAMNVTTAGQHYPHLFKWSDVADPGTIPGSWDVTDPTNEAGAYDLAEDQSEIVDGLPLGEQFIVYKRSGYYSVQYIGAPFIFRFQLVSKQYGGALAVNCVTEFPGGHFVLAPGDVYIHQGGMPQSVIDAKNRKWLFKQLDGDNRGRAFTTMVPQANELWVCFPESGNDLCSLALVWNWKYATWGVRELPQVAHAWPGLIDFQGGLLWSQVSTQWNASELTWQQNLSLLSSMNTMLAIPYEGEVSRLYVHGVGTRFGDDTYDSFVERDNIRFDQPNTVKLVKEVRPLVEGPVGSSLNVYVSASYDQTASPTWYGPFPFTIGVDQKIDCHVVGRVLGVRFQADGDFTWRLKRYDLIVEHLGLY